MVYLLNYCVVLNSVLVFYCYLTNHRTLISLKSQSFISLYLEGRSEVWVRAAASSVPLSLGCRRGVGLAGAVELCFPAEDGVLAQVQLGVAEFSSVQL